MKLCRRRSTAHRVQKVVNHDRREDVQRGVSLIPYEIHSDVIVGDMDDYGHSRKDALVQRRNKTRR